MPGTQPYDRRRFLANASLLGITAASASGILTACGGGSGGGSGRSGEAGETLFFAGLQWGAPKNFNPLGASPAWPCGQNQAQYIYETLVRFNLLNGKLEPGLGTKVQEPDPRHMVVPLQPKAEW